MIPLQNEVLIQKNDEFLLFEVLKLEPFIFICLYGQELPITIYVNICLIYINAG